MASTYNNRPCHDHILRLLEGILRYFEVTLKTDDITKGIYLMETISFFNCSKKFNNLKYSQDFKIWNKLIKFLQNPKERIICFQFRKSINNKIWLCNYGNIRA